MNNRLQFRHHGVGSGYTAEDGVFETREDAIEFIMHDIKNYDDGIAPDGVDNAFSLYAEPTILRYKNEEKEDDPYVLLVIGSYTNDTKFCRSNRFCIIDTHKTESEIDDLKEELAKAVKSLTLIVNDSNTLELVGEKTEDGTFLSGNVKVAESHLFDGEREYKENKIIKTDDGLFIYIDLSYDSENDVIKFTINDVEKELALDVDYPTKGYYSTRDESIHLEMKHGEDIVIDLDNLIAEWIVEGEAAASPIVLTREEVGYGSDSHVHVEPWQDILRADVRIASDRVNNILEKSADNRYLYVDGIATNIAYWKNGEKTNVKETLDELVKIKLSTDSANIISQKVDGFFASSKLEYISNENKLVFTTSSIEGGNKSTEIQLNTFKLFENIYYDASKEALVITYVDGNGKIQFVNIPLGEMMADWEWDVNNYGHSVYLQKVRNVQGADQLSADVNIVENDDNILEEVNHELYVKGTADNIKYGDNSTVKAEIDSLKATDEVLTSDVEKLKEDVEAVSADTATRLKSVVNNDHSINVDNTDAVNPVIKVNLSEEEQDGVKNIIKLNNDGLFAAVDLEYHFDSGSSQNVLVFKTTNGTKTFDLKTNSVVDRIYYDATSEEIVIEYTVNGKRMPDVRIPVRDMIDEIDVQSTSSVELTKTKDTTAGADIIKANVIINNAHNDNILVNDGGLYVSGAQIEANKVAIAENASAIAAEELRATTKENAIASDLAAEIARATTAEEANATAVANEFIRATSAETALNTAIVTLDHKVDDEVAARTAADTAINTSISNINSKLDSEIERSTDKDIALQTALTEEVNNRITAVNDEMIRATSAETALQTALNEEAVSRVSADETLNHKIDDEIARAEAAEAANATAIENEKTRAEGAETVLEGKIVAEETRAKAAESANTAAIEAETARATAAEEAIAADVETLENDYFIAVDNTNTITLSKEAQAKGSVIKANVNISADAKNNIKENADGIFSTVDLTYDSTSNKLTFVSTSGSKEIALVSNSIVNKIYYDAVNEAIVIEYTVNGVRMEDVVVPVRSLINEIDVADTTSVKLTKTPSVGTGADVITADVLLNTVHEDNILVNDGGLYVSGAQIEANKAAIEELQTKTSGASEAISELSNDLAAEVARATAAETANANAIASEVSRATAKENEIASNLATEIERAKSIESGIASDLADEISRSTEKDIALQTALTQEVNDRIAADTAETTRALSAETALNTAIANEANSREIADDALRRDITDEVARARGREDAVEAALNSEITRATAAETANADAIASETTRAKAAESANSEAIFAEATRAAAEEGRIEDKVDTLADDTTYVVRSTNSITLTKADEERGTSITAELNVSDNADNIIKIETDGAYATADLTYDATSNKLTFKTTNGSKEIALVSNSLVERVYYNAAEEKIVIVYKVNGETMPDVEIPVRDLINEIAVTSTSSVEMTKTVSVDGTDVISSNVIINSVHDDNILVNDGGLYVSGAQIEANKAAIAELIANSSSADTKIDDIASDLASEITRAKAAETANANAIASEASRATAKENEIASNLANEVTRATNAEATLSDKLDAEITRSKDRDDAIQSALTQEISDRANAVTAETTRAMSAETTLNTAIATLDHKVDDEAAARESADSVLSGKVATLETGLAAEKTRAEGVEATLNTAIGENATAIASEISRATIVENALQSAVSTVSGSVETLKTTVNTIDEKVEAEKTRAQSAESTLNNAITTNTSAIDAEKARAELAESNIANSVATEKARAEAAEAALDAKIDAKTFEITSEDSSTLDLTVTDGSKISGNVLVANGGNNIIKAAADSSLGTGLYASVDLSYDAATNKLKLTTSALEKEIALSIGSILNSIEYDSVGKNLIIKYETVSAGQVIEQELTVPVEDLFNDWTVQQGEHLGAIILHKTDGVSGNPDVLSAEIVLSTLEDNMLINDQGALYVSSKPIDDLAEEVVEVKEELEKRLATGETDTLNLYRNNDLKLFGDVKISSNELNLIKVDGNNGIIFNGNIDCGEY